MNDLCCVVRGIFFKYLFCKIEILKKSFIIIVGKYLNAIPFNFTWRNYLTVGDISFIGHRFVLWKMIILVKKGASNEHYCVSLWLKHYSTQKTSLIETLWWLTTWYIHINLEKNFKIFIQFHIKLYIGLGLNIMIFVSLFNLLDAICKYLGRSNGHFCPKLAFLVFVLRFQREFLHFTS